MPIPVRGQFRMGGMSEVGDEGSHFNCFILFHYFKDFTE